MLDYEDTLLCFHLKSLLSFIDISVHVELVFTSSMRSVSNYFFPFGYPMNSDTLLIRSVIPCHVEVLHL